MASTKYAPFSFKLNAGISAIWINGASKEEALILAPLPLMAIGLLAEIEPLIVYSPPSAKLMVILAGFAFSAIAAANSV